PGPNDSIVDRDARTGGVRMRRPLVLVVVVDELLVLGARPQHFPSDLAPISQHLRRLAIRRAVREPIARAADIRDVQTTIQQIDACRAQEVDPGWPAYDTSPIDAAAIARDELRRRKRPTLPRRIGAIAGDLVDLICLENDHLVV